MTTLLYGPLGAKALAILAVCAQPKSNAAARAAAWQALDDQFAHKAVWRKTVELQQRGYLVAEANWRESWLTDKGRHALEQGPTRG